MKMMSALSFALMTGAITACGPRVTDRNLDQVRPDMTTKEVESILGAPSRVESRPELRTRETVTIAVTKYVYKQNGKTVELTFVGDRLADGGKDGSFEKKETEGAEAK